MPTEKELLEREIAKLTGVIAGKNKNLTHGHPKATVDARAAGHPYSKPRGGRVTGNKTFRPGQNQSLILNHNHNHNNQASVPSSSAGSSSLNVPSGSSSTANNNLDTSINAVANPPIGIPTRTSKEEEEGRWVNNTSRHGNKSLINPEIYLQQQKARLAHSAKPQSTSTIPSSSSSSNPASRRSTRRKYDTQLDTRGKRVVVIDGVVYEFEGDGKKLKRTEEGSASTTTTTEPDIIIPTRSSFSISGQQYVRTRAGNLVRRKSSAQGLNKKSVVSERFSPGPKPRAYTLDSSDRLDVKKRSQPCRYFTKTGACQRASTCPYVHDPDKISVCSKYLRGNCPHSDDACPVSHHPNPHNAPSCVHFQRTGQCRNGKDCRYPHVKVKDDAPVCLDFSTIGWCERGATCGERHAWECREYSESGTCKRGKKCELMHILRAKNVGGGGGGGAGQTGVTGEQAGDVEGNVDGTALPEDLVEVLRAQRQSGVRPSESSSQGDSDDDDEDEAGDDEVVDTEDEEDDVDVIAGQQDFIQFQQPDDTVDMDRSE